MTPEQTKRVEEIRRDRFECPSLLDPIANRLMHRDIPWLLDVIDQLTAENEELKEALSGLNYSCLGKDYPGHRVDDLLRKYLGDEYI